MLFYEENKKVINLLRVNWQTMAEFEILYKVFLWVFAFLFLTLCMAVYSMVESGRSFFDNAWKVPLPPNLYDDIRVSYKAAPYIKAF